MRPSALIADWPLSSVLGPPFASAETSVVVPADRSRTYTLRAVGETPGTRLWATDSNATTDPFADTAGATLAPSAAAPEPALISSVGPFGSVRANTSVCWLASPATRLLASDSNATTDPSAEIDGLREPASPWRCRRRRRLLGVAIVVVPATVSRTKIWATPGPGIEAREHDADVRDGAAVARYGRRRGVAVERAVGLQRGDARGARSAMPEQDPGTGTGKNEQAACRRDVGERDGRPVGGDRRLRRPPARRVERHHRAG